MFAVVNRYPENPTIDPCFGLLFDYGCAGSIRTLLR
jgi:hypothetical protein